MSRSLLMSGIAILFGYCSSAQADWAVADRGLWPDSWPSELEPLRDQARTLQGGLAELTFYEIEFRTREEFEAAWPHILEIKTEGIPITLYKAPHSFLGTLKAGVRIWHPSYADRNIWLIVDGSIVDLNRIEIPEGTTIIDRRFDDDESSR